MNYPLDTQIVIWSLDDNPRLTQAAKDIIEDTQNTIYITIASLWEIAIKRSINKPALTKSLQDIRDQVSSKQVSILPGHNRSFGNSRKPCL